MWYAYRLMYLCQDRTRSYAPTFNGNSGSYNDYEIIIFKKVIVGIGSNDLFLTWMRKLKS